MQRPGPQQISLSSVRELLGRRRANSIKIGGIGAVECGICIMVCDLPNRRKHTTNNCHRLQKYTQTSQQLFCNFCRSVGHDEHIYQSYELMMDQTLSYRVQAKMWALNPNVGMVRAGFQGHGRGQGGMGPGRGCELIICYNCRGPGHYARDCTNPNRISCSYCTQFYHEAKDFPLLIAKMHEKGVL